MVVTPITTAIDQLDRVLNDSDLEADDLSTVQGMIDTLSELNERYPMLGLVIAQ